MTKNERREESVRFSLEELQRLEEERLAEQARRDEAAMLASRRAEDEAILRERERHEAEVRAAEEERRASEQRALDALARREAESRALVEQATLEVEVRARADERERERVHELAIARAKADAERQRPKGIVVGSALLGVAVALLVVGGIHYGALKPAVDRRLALLEDDAASAKARARESEAEAGRMAQLVEERGRTIAELTRKLDAANAGASPHAPPKVPGSLPNMGAPPDPKSGTTRGGASSHGANRDTKGDAPCPQFDPMCFRIERPPSR